MLTENQKARLHLSIELAEGFKLRKYVIDDEPACVMAQLSFFEGVPLLTMREWDKEGGQHIAALAPIELALYPMHLLRRVQLMWDGMQERGLVLGPHESEAPAARVRMHALVDAYQG